MCHKLKYIVAAFFAVSSLAVQAQVTVQSPYSKFGIGNIKGSLLPQMRGIGGVSTAVSRHSYMTNINMQNPASYATIGATTLDMGASGSFSTLNNSNVSEKSFNSTLSHVAAGFNLGRKSGLSFGIMPYSELGYNFKTTGVIGNNEDNQRDVEYIYTGEGGLTKSYIGYGFGIGDHLRVGANVEYLFGELAQKKSTQFISDPGSLSSSIHNRNSVGGIGFSYGAQYDIRFNSKTSLVFGYSGSSASKIHSKKTSYVTHYFLNTDGAESQTLETLYLEEGVKTNLQLPLIHNFGVVLQKNDRWLVGADFRTGKWSKLTIDKVNQNLQDTYGFSVGGQFVPDFSSINNYLKRVEYRLGFQYDKTYIQLANKDVKEVSVSAGLGLPLAAYTRNVFYRANITAQVGTRGSVTPGLIQEKFFNIHLGFTLNDQTWFRRFKFD